MVVRAKSVKEIADGLGLNGAPELYASRPAIVDLDELKYEKLSDKKIIVTVEKAASYVDLPVFEGERDVAPEWAQYLLDEMRRGLFNWDAVTIAKADLNGVTYKVNGQHSMWARIGLEAKEDPQVRETHYRVDSIEQLKALYSTYDRSRPRTNAHLTRVSLAGTDVAEGLTTSLMTSLSAGIKWWLFSKEEDYRRCRPAELGLIIKERHKDLYRTVGFFMKSLDKDACRLASRQPVCAGLFETFDRVPTIAPTFWKDCLDGTNLAKKDARYHLKKYFDTTVLGFSRHGTDKQTVSAEEMYRMSIAAWNRWRDGDEVELLRPTQKRVRAK